MGIKKKLHAEVSMNNWSYIVNENGNAIRLTLEEYGSCTPVPILQKWIERLSKKEYEKIWQKCELKKDVRD